MSGAGSPLDLGTLPVFSSILRRDGEERSPGPVDDLSAEFTISEITEPSVSAALQHARVDLAWEKYKVDGEGILVAVIDSGCNPQNPGLRPRVLPGKAFLGGPAGTDTRDEFGHGTSVAGVIAADGGRGAAPGAQILPLKIYKDDKDSQNVMLRLADALEHVTGLDAVSVVNISLGNSCNHASDTDLPEELKEVAERISNAVRHLRQKHVPVVAAAGNDYASFDSAIGMCFPAIMPNVISVGAVHSNDKIRNVTYPYGSDLKRAITVRSRVDVLAPFSQRLPHAVGTAFTRLIAPGAPVLVFGSDGRLTDGSGTSVAAPLVTGVIALMQQLHKRNFGQRPTCADIEDWLIAGAQKIQDTPGEHVSVRNTGATFHRVDALGALDRVPDPNRPSS
jgi:subtilisin family serine protease